MKVLHIKIADVIGMQADFFGWFPGFTALELEFRLQEIPNPDKIVLHISSPGGDVEEGLQIYNRLVELREAGTIISVIVESHCYSIATLIAMAASAGELKMREAALWCTHKPMYPEVYYANADDLRRYANNLDACETAISAAYVRRTGKAATEVADELRKDAIISAADAVANGWVDGTIENTPEQTQEATAKATALKPVAFVRPKSIENSQIKKPMEGKNKQTAGGISAAMKKLAALAKDIMNIAATTDESGTGTEGGAESGSVTLDDEAGTVIYFAGDLAVDTAVFTDEAMETPVADGDHKLEDGRTITVAAGIVTVITPAEEDNNDDDQAEAIKAKDDKIAELESKIKELEKGTPEAVKKMETMVATLSAELEKVKKFVPGSGDQSKRSAQQQFPDTSKSKNDGKPSALSANAKNLKN